MVFIVAATVVVAVLLLLAIVYRIGRMAHSRPSTAAAGSHSHGHGPVQRASWFQINCAPA